MKKLSNLIFSLVALSSMLLTFSCGTSGDDDDDSIPAPTITITSEDFDEMTLTAVGNPDNVVTATIRISAEGIFNTMRITKTGGETDSKFPVEEIKEEETTPTTHLYSFVYKILEAEIGEDVSFLIEAIDDADQKTEEILTVMTEAAPGTPARIYSAILLAAPLDNKLSETFFSTTTGEIYSSNMVTASSTNISTTIDFGYYYGSTSGAHLASPEAFLGLVGLKAQVNGWTVLNNITFKETEITEEMFIELDSWEDIDEIYEEATVISAPGNIAELAIGDVVAFETDSDKPGESKKGLVFVNNLNEGAGANGSIELDIIVQEESEE